jgi:hypothetical protein
MLTRKWREEKLDRGCELSGTGEDENPVLRFFSLLSGSEGDP